jgi:hypothetical protein
MRKAASIIAALGAALTLFSGVQALPQVSRVGKYLYSANGTRFMIKGIAYQEQGVVVAAATNAFGEPSTFIDPLANGTACARDIPYLQQLGVNTIRVYSVDSTQNHDACMQALSSAGIYTIIDLSLPVNGSIDRASPSWTTNLLNVYIQSIEAFSKYDNVLAYNIGNEVVIAPNGTAAGAFIKAAARDTKAYLASISSTALVGYAAIDGDDTWRFPLASYLSCDPSGSNSGSTAIDLYGLNNYEWCGDATVSVYATTDAAFTSYNVPAYFSEFGCITSPPRVWTEVAAMFTTPMSDIWSGGIAFSYFPAASAAGQFGMVNISADGSTVTASTDFTSLQTQYGLVTVPNSPTQSAAGSTSYPACPAETTNFLASTTLPPTPNSAACSCLESILSCRFTPTTSNTSAILGPLLDTGCSLLGQQGLSCADIAGNGTTGTYGRVSGCDPATQLSFIMSEFYEANNRNAQSCSFGGNGTVNTAAPSSVTAANAAASSCVSNPSAVFTPTAPSGSPGSPSSSGTGKSGKSAAAPLIGDSHGTLGLAMLVLVSVSSALWTLT